jgi:hypothetical protein
MTRARASVVALTALVGALSAEALLARLGSRLPLPAGSSRTQIDSWLRHEGAIRASFEVTRGLGLILALYLGLLAVLALVAALSGAAGAARLALRVSLPSVRPLIAPLVAITVTVASAAPGAAQGRGQPPPVMQVVAAPDAAPPVMRVVVSTAVAAPAAAPSATHTVVSGDTFWSIAEDALRSGPSSSETDVATYWRALVELNRDRLRVAGEPDLIFPGQVFDLPPVS